MKRLTREKRQQLLLVALATLGALTGVWFGLMRPQQLGLERVAGEILQAQRQLDEARKLLARAPEILEALDTASTALEQREEQMAAGDYYAFVINRIRQFRLDYDVDIPQFGTITGPTPVDLLPRFPYQQVSLTIAGTGYYHEIGRFVADFENRFPYWQIRNLELEAPASGSSDPTGERLSFRMTLVALVRPGA